MDKDTLKGGNMWRKAIILVVSGCFVWGLSLYADKDVTGEVDRIALIGTTIGQPSIAKNATDVKGLGVSKRFVRSKAETVIFGPEDFSTWLPEGWDTIINNTEWTGTHPCTWGQFTDYYHSEPACAGLWWSYSDQDEWLISPEVPLTGAASGIYVLRFWTYGYEGSTYGDHYWVEISTDHGATWTPVFDLADLPGNAWNEWDYPYEIDLSEYAGDTIMFAFHAWAIGGLWYAWMVDDPEIFYPSDYDVAVVTINSPAGYVQPDMAVTPSVTVQNLGGMTVTFDVGFEIYDAEDNQIYSSTATVTDLAYGETQEVTFAPDWTPPAEGNYTAVAYTMLEGDEDPTNDTLTAPFEVTTMWVDTLFYDDGTVANAGAFYDEGNGFGYKFTPEAGQYPVQVNGVLLYFYEGWPDPGGDRFRVMICDDDGPDGAPGTKVYVSPVISGATTGAWNYVDLSAQYIGFEDGSFYVFYIQVGDYPNCLGLCADGAINTPYGCAWEYFADGDSFAVDDLSWIGGDWLLRAEIVPYSPPAIEVAMHDIIAPVGMYELGETFVPMVKIRNIGTETVSPTCGFVIPDIYSEEVTVTVAGGEIVEVTFPEGTFETAGTYYPYAYVYVEGDENPANDTMYGEPVVVLPPLGYEEGFEAAVIPPPAWQQYILGDPTSPGWQVYTGTEDWTGVETPPIEGSYAVGHNDDDLSTSAEDWLVTPLLNVDAGARLTFYHMTNYAPSWTEYRGVWVSTGSRDPADGDYVEVLDMSGMASDEEWSLVDVDLSPYEGQSVYVGFKYVGDWADEWFIDGVKGYGLTIGEMPWDVSIPTPEIEGVEAATEGTAISMGVEVYNSSMSPEPTDLRVVMRVVYEPTGAIVFNDFRDVTIDPGESRTVYFDEWVPIQPGNYIGNVVLQTEADPNLSNNMLVDTFNVAAKLGVAELPNRYEINVKTVNMGQVRFSYALPNAGDVQLTIHDAMGRKVYELTQYMDAGYGEIGVELNSGIYFYRYVAGKYVKAGKIIVLE